MTRRCDVLIFHLEGNFRGNPTMDALLRELGDAGVRVVIVSFPFEHLDQTPPSPTTTVQLLPRWQAAVVARLLTRGWRLLLALVLAVAVRPPAAPVQVGVDRSGLLMSDAWRRRVTRLRVLLSFEIFFASESSEAYKRPERRASERVDLAVAQDDVRADLLASENGIARDRIVTVPVAPRGAAVDAEPGFVHRRFGVPSGSHVAAVVGSVAPWSGMDLLAACASELPQGWVLLLHDRNGFLKTPLHDPPGSVVLSTEPVPGLEGLAPLLADTDVGVAFYTPTYEDVFVGANIEHVGLASGKVSMYLQYGIPVIVNDRHLLGRTVEEHRIGVRIDGPDEFAAALETILADLDGYRQRARAFFEEHLEAGAALAPLVTSLKRALEGRL